MTESNDYLPALLYEQFKAVAANQKKLDDAVEEIRAQNGHYKPASLRIKYKAFKAMLKGSVFFCLPNRETTDYFLRGILNDYGLEVFEKALRSTREHIRFYRRYKGAKQNKIRESCQKLADDNGVAIDFSDAMFDEPTPQITDVEGFAFSDDRSYTRDDFLNEVFLDDDQYDALVKSLRNKKNVILQGPPGVGKTFCAKRLAWSMVGEKIPDRIATVQFHQSYSYEDFMLGYRPNATGGFELKTGAFYRFCKKAETDPNRDYFFVIDEINRGNASKIFGELLSLIENDKRGESLIPLYSDEEFSVPKNLYIVGLKNTADRSLAAFDFAFERRFAFFQFDPPFETDAFKTYRDNLESTAFNSLIDRVIAINREISADESLGPGFQIGCSYFCGLEDASPEEIVDRLTQVVEFELIPLLSEYWFDDRAKLVEAAARLRDAVR